MSHTTDVHSQRFYESEAKRFKVKIAACLLLMDHQKICLQRRQKTGIDDGWYTIPMGSVEQDERPVETLIREAKEEANIEILPENVSLGHSMYRKHTLPDGYIFYQQDLFFHVTVYSGEIKNLEPEKADDLRFFNLSDLPTKLVPHVAQAIDCTIKGQPYSEFGWEYR
jgi:8-oxo-dGTP diphosphatase